MRTRDPMRTGEVQFLFRSKRKCVFAIAMARHWLLTRRTLCSVAVMAVAMRFGDAMRFEKL